MAIKSDELINKEYEENRKKITSIFSKLRECVDEREKTLLENLGKMKDKKNKMKFLDKIMKDINKISEEVNKNNVNLEEKFLKINETNMIKSNQDIINYKKEIKNNDYHFIYEENALNEILNKIKNFGHLKKNSNIEFKWKTGQNYTLSENKTIASKTGGGNSYNCNILGDIILPKNVISKWKIKLNKFSMSSGNGWDILIGVGPSNINQNEMNLYEKTWTFICGYSAISINRGNPSYIYEKHSNEKLKEGDIVEVIIDNIKNELSFSINGIYYGIACKLPSDIDLSPFVLIYDQGESIELLNV